MSLSPDVLSLLKKENTDISSIITKLELSGIITDEQTPPLLSSYMIKN